jgi:hypothetical protein
MAATTEPGKKLSCRTEKQSNSQSVYSEFVPNRGRVQGTGSRVKGAGKVEMSACTYTQACPGSLLERQKKTGTKIPVFPLLVSGITII